MQPNWAEENLQVIRTLMERAGLYRRALAPVMLLVGVVGVGAAIGAQYALVNTYADFLRWWVTTCLVAMLVVIGFARQQAWREKEPLLTAPAKRVVSALLAPYLSALVVSTPFRLITVDMSDHNTLLPLYWLIGLWLLLHGCALNAAGMFISLGVRRLAWVFVLAGVALIALAFSHSLYEQMDPHLLMGATFGGFHLVAGIYLYFTERREPTP